VIARSRHYTSATTVFINPPPFALPAVIKKTNEIDKKTEIKII